MELHDGVACRSSPAVANGIVYVGSFDDNVYAFAPVPIVPTDWPQFRSDPTHSGNNASESVLSPYTVGGMIEQSRISIAGSSSPAVVNDGVYVGSSDGKVYALALGFVACPQLPCPLKLVVRWSFPTGGPVHSSPAVANGVVYVGSFDRNVYALDAATGAVLWSYTTGNSVNSPPVVIGGVVYVGSDDGNIYALNAATGAALWSFTTGAPVASSPAVANGVVYVGSGDGKVYALNATTGVSLWSFTAGIISSSPAVANGVVYVGSDDNNVYALDATTGAVLWSYTTGSAVRCITRGRQRDRLRGRQWRQRLRVGRTDG